MGGRDHLRLYSSFIALAPTADPPSMWLVMAAFVGLPLALWAYKCAMMIIFQRKIIYMGYVPPGARSQELDKDVRPAKGILCSELSIPSDGNVTLRGIMVRRDVSPDPVCRPETIIFYLQGNAGNPLGRLPLFERLLLGASLSPTSSKLSSLNTAVIFAFAPRSYWKSTNKRPTQQRMISDYIHALTWLTQTYPSSTVIFYGHSLGGAAAVCLSSQVHRPVYPGVKGMILENPFASIPWMVRALYPQKWLPYHYLGRFAFDKWDALKAMRNADRNTLLETLMKDVMVVVSEKDEVVPNEMGTALFDIARKTSDADSLRRLAVIPGALHDNAYLGRKWRTEIEAYIQAVRVSLITDVMAAMPRNR